WAGKAIAKLVKAQGEALVKGDEAAYLASVDPTNKALVSEHRKRFKILRAMDLGKWTEDTRSGAYDDGVRAWWINLSVGYCVGNADCETVKLSMKSRWAYKSGKLVMVKLDKSGASDQGPRPWEVDD